MAFSSRDELKTFLNNKGDWKRWLKMTRACNDKILVEREPMTDKDINNLMKGKV